MIENFDLQEYIPVIKIEIDDDAAAASGAKPSLLLTWKEELQLRELYVF